MIPPLRDIALRATTRLIPSRYSDNGDSVLARIANDDAHLQVIFDLDHASNDRLLAENDRAPGIGVDELVFGVPHAQIVNAAFCHPSPTGSRFNSPDRGAWYAAIKQKTALAEVVFHKTLALAEIDHFHDSVTYDAYLADISGAFHDLRGQPDFAACLNPLHYDAGQELAERLLALGSSGIVYPSVRDRGGVCIAVMRPAIVQNPRKGQRLRLSWTGTPIPAVSVEAA